MLIISKSIKLSEQQITSLGETHLIINGVDTSYGADDLYISIEKTINKMQINVKDN